MLILMYNSHYMSVRILSFRPISTNGQSATLAPLSRHCIKTDLFPFGESPLNSMKGIKSQDMVLCLSYTEIGLLIKLLKSVKF